MGDDVTAVLNSRQAENTLLVLYMLLCYIVLHFMYCSLRCDVFSLIVLHCIYLFIYFCLKIIFVFSFLHSFHCSITLHPVVTVIVQTFTGRNLELFFTNNFSTFIICSVLRNARKMNLRTSFLLGENIRSLLVVNLLEKVHDGLSSLL